MKRVSIWILACILCFVVGAATIATSFYPRSGFVTEIDYETDSVTFTDCVGFDWSFYGVEDFNIGDRVNAIMFDCFTKNIFDDRIVKVRYEAN